jgi:hypothetical protein
MKFTNLKSLASAIAALAGCVSRPVSRATSALP